ncbi:uncharacterized protein OCT59_009321 [Rhizophagus irregularis]|uniref:uncharacterized protein n=1 Tax=Rhizophagus irregularis TaxID=588596 RepID=UPI00332F96E9|nr:hypothetical protein OCT59_009321 [Rhizophagus irregularis]
MSTRKRTILSAAQKREICETKEREPNLSNTSIAQRYNIGKSTVTDILNEKERWLAISGDKGSVKKFRGPKWPQLEKALGLWVDNALNMKQDIDGNILKTKAVFFAERFSIEDFHQSEDGIVEVLADYNIFEALQNSAEAWSMVSSQTISNCWKKTGILPPSDDEIEDGDSIFDDFEEEEAELERLIALLPEGHLDAREYINIEDEMAAEGALTDEEIIDAVLNADKEEEIVINDDEFVPILEKVSLKEAEKSVDNTIRFLYEQGPEFGEVNEELRILKGLHKRVKLQLVKNLKQLNLHNFHD